MTNKTVLGLSAGEKVIIAIIPPLLGALLGWFVPTVADWVIKIPFIPFEGVFKWVTTLESDWVSIIAAILGVLAGVFFVLYAFSESLKIIITDEEVKLIIKGSVKIIHKEELSAIYMEGKHVVFLTTDGTELFRGQPESKKELISEAFRQHRYPWREKDPFENQYQRWVTDHPDFPPHVNALLYARERALKNEETDEAKVLRKDLADLGVVIRDEDHRQYVRVVER